MMTARDVIDLLAEAVNSARYGDDYPPALRKTWEETRGSDREYSIRLARGAFAALPSFPESVRLELAAQLNPWRPGPAPEHDDMPTHGIEITADGRWRPLLPPAAPLEDKP